MKKKIVLAAVLTAMCIFAGCSFKEPEPEITTAESTTPAATTAEETTAKETTEPSSEEETTPEETSEPEISGSRIIIATDMHYLARELTDFQSSFTNRVEHEDGKVMQYVWEITDAFIYEVKKEKPDLVILSGDLTYNGEWESHIEFAEKLEEIEEAGIPVIVIPGNHDINNRYAVRFTGDSVQGIESIEAEDFEDIYQNFGYNEAVSRDSASLSYVYQVNDYTRALMLDSCQYYPRNLVGGMIKNDTYDWIEEQMEEAWNLGMNVIPVAHHNLLDESEVYLEDCTIEHSEQLIDQLESWEVPLFLSGHLHVQHHMRSGEDSGIYEIVTSSLTTPPCQYGILDYGDDGSFQYHTKALDMEGWAKQAGVTNKELLNFNEFGKQFLSKVFYNQAQDEFKLLDSLKNLTPNQREQMAKVYAELNVACSSGKVFEIRDKAMMKNGYKLWMNEGYQSILSQYLEWIIRDGTKDYNVLTGE